MFPLLILPLVKLAVAKIFLDPAFKAMVVDDLRKAAKDTENPVDDKAVDVLEAGWDVVFGALIKK